MYFIPFETWATTQRLMVKRWQQLPDKASPFNS